MRTAIIKREKSKNTNEDFGNSELFDKAEGRNANLRRKNMLIKEGDGTYYNEELSVTGGKSCT